MGHIFAILQNTNQNMGNILLVLKKGLTFWGFLNLIHFEQFYFWGTLFIKFKDEGGVGGGRYDYDSTYLV